MDETIRRQTSIHELGHAWIALQPGYKISIEIGELGNSSGRLATEPAIVAGGVKKAGLFGFINKVEAIHRR